MRAAAAILACLIACAAHATEFRTIGDRAAILFDAPSLKADRLFVASRGHPFEVLVRLDQWTKVRDAGGEVAWVENRAFGERRNAMVSVPIADVGAAPGAPLPARSRRSSSRPTSRYCWRCSKLPQTGGSRCDIATGSRGSRAPRTSGASSRR